MQGGIRVLSDGGPERLGRLALDQQLAAGSPGLGSNHAGLGSLSKEFANPPRRDPESLGNLLLGTFIRVDRRQDPHPQVD
jgi:hypothetical protein